MGTRSSRRATAAFVSFAALVSLLGAGCTTRTILRFEDHGTQAVTSLQVLTSSHYVLWSSAERQFFLCNDAGARLVCKRACGGDLDVVCPEAGGVLLVTTNVR